MTIGCEVIAKYWNWISYLSKPFDPQSVILSIESLVRHPSMKWLQTNYIDELLTSLGCWSRDWKPTIVPFREEKHIPPGEKENQRLKVPAAKGYGTIARRVWLLIPAVSVNFPCSLLRFFRSPLVHALASELKTEVFCDKAPEDQISSEYLQDWNNVNSIGLELPPTPKSINQPKTL